MFYFEASIDSVDDLVPPSNHGWDKNYDYKWNKYIYPEDVASLLVTISGITLSKDEWDEIDFETDVTDIFKMDSEDDDYSLYSLYSNSTLLKGGKIIMNIRWEVLTICSKKLATMSTIGDQETIHKHIEGSNFSYPFV